MAKTNVKFFPFGNELVHCRLFSILSSIIKNDLSLFLFTSSKTSNFDLKKINILKNAPFYCRSFDCSKTIFQKALGN